MPDHSETRRALWTTVTRLRTHAQELDREAESLDEQATLNRAGAVEDRRLANHIGRAAEVLSELDTGTV